MQVVAIADANRPLIQLMLFEGRTAYRDSKTHSGSSEELLCIEMRDSVRHGCRNAVDAHTFFMTVNTDIVESTSCRHDFCS